MKQYKYVEIIERLSLKGSVLGLTNMRRLLEILGHPEKELKIVHTAGTNGKGSTLAFLAEILMESGYNVGRYISPTIACYEERFQINHQYISQDDLEACYLQIEEACQLMEEKGWDSPTLFEAETAIAFLYFLKEKVDYVLLEVGMGGLMDATNAIEKTDLTIITSISEDHKGFLGNNIEEIAMQKAGIIKKNTPLVLAINQECVIKLVRKKCQEEASPFQMVDENKISILKETATGSSFLYDGVSYEIGLPGTHQIHNAATALLAAQCLKKEGALAISQESMVLGLKKTIWPGRLELLMKQPPLYLDGAHNPDGARKLADFLQKHFTNKSIIYIMGVLGDKEYEKMLSYLMPLAKGAYVFTPNNKRGLQSHLLAKAMEPYGCPVHIYEQVSQALEEALAQEKDADCFVLCGSLSFIEEMRKDFNR